MARLNNFEIREVRVQKNFVDFIYYPHNEEIIIIDVANILNGDISSFKKSYFLSEIETGCLQTEKEIESLIKRINEMKITFIDL